MDDIKIKNALVAIATFNEKTLESLLSLEEFLAKRLPSFSEDERGLLLSAVDADRKRLQILKDVLRQL
jgi:hypothetical protein